MTGFSELAAEAADPELDALAKNGQLSKRRRVAAAP